MQKLGFISPLRKKETSHFSLTSLNNDLPDETHQKLQDLPALFNTLINMSSKIQIQHDMSNFNLVEYDNKQKNMQFDKQMISAKLKRLQNNAELKRANYALEIRKRKSLKPTLSKQYQIPTLQEKDHYLNAFKTIKMDKKNSLFDQEIQTQSEDEHDKLQKEQPVREGIVYYNQLKKHPKILNYTLQKMKYREMLHQQLQNKKKNNLETFKNELKRFSHSQYLTIKQPLVNYKSNEVDPEQIAGDIFRKIYTKNNKERSTSQARSNMRMNKFIDKQDQIFQTIDKRSLSKENYKKMRHRFNEIINEIYDVEKKYIHNQIQRQTFCKTARTSPRKAK